MAIDDFQWLSAGRPSLHAQIGEVETMFRDFWAQVQSLRRELNGMNYSTYGIKRPSMITAVQKPMDKSAVSLMLTGRLAMVVDAPLFAT